MYIWNLDYYVLGEVITCLLSFILCCSIFVSFSFYDKRQRIFGWAVVATFLSSLFDIASSFCVSYVEIVPTWIGTICSTLFYLSLCAVPFFISLYAVEISFAYRPEERKKLIFFNICCCVVYLIFIIVNLFTGIVFRYDVQLGYVRGSLNLIAYFLTGVFTVITIVSVLINKKSMAKRIYLVFLAYPIISVAFLVIQFTNNQLLMTGLASFAALLCIYLTIQSDLLEYDVSTGLMTENKLRKQIASKRGEGALYVLSIENMKMLLTNMDATKLNMMILNIGKEFSKTFERSVFHISTSRFAAIGKNMEDTVEKGQKIENYLKKLSEDSDLGLPTNVEFHSAVINLHDYDFTYSTLMDVINTMLLRARNSGLRTIQVCDESVILEISRKQNIYNILKRELNSEDPKIQVWYQPVYSLKDRRYTQIEALARLNGTELGDISPAEFIPIAESKGLIDKLGQLIFDKVCKFISEDVDLIRTVSVNFSVFQMANSNVVNNVLSTIEKYKISTSNIVIEVDENIFDETYYNIIVENIKKLSEAGIRFHLDNFGTGKANINQIFSLPFTKIKFSRALLLMAEKSNSEGNLLTGLANTFRKAKFKTLAVGVETKEQLILVNRAGIGYVQGFLSCKPMPPEKTVNFLEVKMLM